MLSSAAQTSIEIDSLLEGIDFYVSITRTRFEELCQDLFRETLEPIKKVLKDAGVSKDDVHDIVFTGGSSHIPHVITLVSDFFNGKKPKMVNPNEAVARGAALQAAVLSGDESVELQDFLLVDAVPHSISIENNDGTGICTRLIKSGTTYPVKNSEILSTNVGLYAFSLHVCSIYLSFLQ